MPASDQFFGYFIYDFFRRGAMSELVKDKKTGIFISSIADAVRKFPSIKKIKRRDCRNWAEKFSIKNTVDNYEKVYYKIINKTK